VDRRNKKADPKPTEQDKARLHALSMKRWDVGLTLGKYAIWALCIVGCFYVGVALPVKYSAGQTTTISYLLTWAQTIKLDVLLAYGAVAGTTAWAISERLKRIRERKEKDARIASLEQRLDPNRTSSGLLPDGSQPNASNP
jgi:hypothetical protein